MGVKEARARIKINELLIKSGWRFFDDDNCKANIVLENNVKISMNYFNGLGKNFEKTKNGFIDFLLLDDKGFPFIVLEAKAEDKDPLIGKEQARKYAKSLNVKYIILSNGNLHYFWNIEKGNPNVITTIPTLESLKSSKVFNDDPLKLYSEKVNDNYIALTQNPHYEEDPRWVNEASRNDYIFEQKLRFLRPYQINAIKALQQAAKAGSDRFLFEMATGTGKTLTSAAIIKLFLRTGNARRVLFLVDRIELENQAKKNFDTYLKNDYTSVIYKENKDDWRKGEIVVSTVQSLSYNNKFMRMFSPTDFDLIISDEAHRSINGNNRAVFEYFIGYKLGLTATPKDYLKKVDTESMSQDDPRQWERRQLLDTYKTFGCESGTPTFRYTLIDGVRDGFLVNPIVVDARTAITTQLLSDEGYAMKFVTDEGSEEEQIFYQKDFERKFFSDETNRIFCKTFMENAKKDPVSKEIGKTITFCVSRKHASKIVQILNEFADKVYRGKYNSDFAMQITSDIPDAQQYTINFANNNLSGHTGFLEDYKSSKTRICVTVGMMTTGYDCEDLLNVVLMRPIFSPTDFIQIKGRGTRKHTFYYRKKENGNIEETFIVKDNFKMFDFFANCEYFEEKFNYDEVIELPKEPSGKGEGGGDGPVKPVVMYNTDPDPLMFIAETPIGEMGMKIDRKLCEKFEEDVRNDDFVRKQYEEGNIAAIESYIKDNIFNKPNEYYDMDKLRKATGVDRRLSLSEILDRIFGRIDWFKSKNELMEEEFEKYILTNNINGEDYYLIKNFFKAYIVDRDLRNIIDDRQFAKLATNPHISMSDIKKLGNRVKDITEYIKDNINLNKFAA